MRKISLKVGFLSTPSFKENKKEHTSKDYSLKERIVNYNSLLYCWVNALIAAPWASRQDRKERAMREGVRERIEPKAKEVSTMCHKILLSIQSGQGVA